MKWKTRFTNKIGDEEYPIYLIEEDIGFGDIMFNLECEHEIPALAWYTVYEESMNDILNLKEMKENED